MEVEVGNPVVGHLSSLGKNDCAGLMGDNILDLCAQGDEGVVLVVLVGDNMSELVAEGDRGQRNASNGESSSVIVEADDTTSDLVSTTPESVLVDVDLASVCRKLSIGLLLFLEPESVLVDVALTGVCRKLSSGILLFLEP